MAGSMMLSGPMLNSAHAELIAATALIPAGNDGYSVVIVIIVAIVLVLAIARVLHRRCPKCHRWKALERTGGERQGKYERRCKYCDYNVWKHRHHPPVRSRTFY